MLAQKRTQQARPAAATTSSAALTMKQVLPRFCRPAPCGTRGGDDERRVGRGAGNQQAQRCDQACARGSAPRGSALSHRVLLHRSFALLHARRLIKRVQPERAHASSPPPPLTALRISRHCSHRSSARNSSLRPAWPLRPCALWAERVMPALEGACERGRAPWGSCAACKGSLSTQLLTRPGPAQSTAAPLAPPQPAASMRNKRPD